jgi:predicted transcriptional regulator
LLQPQEVVVSKLLPNLRARVAQVLIEAHHMKQVEVAKRLGITQAAVSHYNTKSRGLDKEIMRLFPEIETHAQDLAARIYDGLTQAEQISEFTRVVESIMRTERFCRYHQKVAGIDPTCDICFPNLAGVM